MARGRKVGEAFVEVVAETDGFERDLERSIDRAVKEAAKQEKFEALVRGAGNGGEDAAHEFEQRFVREIRARRLPMAAEVAKIGAIAGSGFADLFNGSFGRSGGRGLFGGSFFSSISSGLSSGLDAITPGLESIAGFLAPMGKFLAIGALLIPVIFALGGALFSLLGLLGALPGLAFGVVAAFAPLLIIFQGFGDAVSALASGDMEKFNESLKKLTPSARGVVGELKNLFPIFTEIRKSVQEAFFSRITGDLTRLFNVIKGPALAGLSNVSFALGGFVHQLLQLAGSRQVVDFFARLFQSVTEGIRDGGPVIIRFFNAIIGVAKASLPAISAFFTRLGKGVDQFSDFLLKSIEDGSFQAFLDSAFATLGDLVGVTTEFFGLLKDMFLTADEGGRTFLQDVRDAIKELREFFQSPDGKQFIKDMIELAGAFGKILIWITGLVENLTINFRFLIDLILQTAHEFDKLRGKTGAGAALGVGANDLTAAARALFPKMARGGITDGPSLAGEAGTEAVLPLDDPTRARQVASDPRVVAAIGGGDTTVIAIFDGEPFQARITRTIRGSNSAAAVRIAQKSRV